MESSADTGTPPDGGFSFARNQPRTAHLVLADGAIFAGEAVGAPTEVVTGELSVSTEATDHQATITDPAGAGRIIAFTTPHIGNLGVLPADEIAAEPACRGIVVRELTRRPSNWRSIGDLATWLVDHHVPGIAEVDTRRLVRHLRHAGPVRGAFGAAGTDVLLAAARASEPAAPGEAGAPDPSGDEPKETR